MPDNQNSAQAAQASSPAAGAAIETVTITRKGPLVAALIALALALVAAIAGFALYAGARVPQGSAAKVNDSYLTEDAVDRYITQYRLQHGLTDEESLANALNSQGMSVRTFRGNAIDQLAITELVNARARELGIEADAAAVQEHIDTLKQTLAFGDDEIWAQTLEQYGTSEDEIRQQYADSLVQQDVCEHDVAKRDATDAETLSYAASNLAKQTVKHYYRIVFTGDDQVSRAKACAEEIEAAAADGKLDATWFQGLAKAESDSESAADDGGDYGWSIDLDQSSEAYEDIADMAEGGVSAQLTITADNATEIFYCDETYRFPSKKKTEKLEKGDLPASLWDSIAAKESDAIWSADCASYLARLVAQAQVTVYPMPENASYNVDLQEYGSASSSSSSGEDAGASDSSAGASAE